MVKHGNYWFETYTPENRITSGLPRAVDVAIIGGGLTGYSLLIDLIINTNLSVVLLEADSPGFHASGRNMGHIGEIDPILLSKITSVLGNDVVQKYVEMIRANNDALRCIIDSESISCDYEKIGGFYVDKGESALQGFSLFPTSSCVQFIGKDAAQALMPSHKVGSAIYVPGEAVLNPYKLIHGLHDTCQSMGQHVLPNASVQRVVPVSDGLKLYIRNRGTFMAKNVVHCTGAYSQNLIRELRHVSLRKRHTIITSALPEEVLAGFMNAPMTNLYKSARICDKRILISDDTNPVSNSACDGLIDQSAFQRLNSWWPSVFPSIPKTVSADRVWSHVNCTGKDSLPLIGPIPDRPGEFLNIGCGSNFTFSAAFMIRHYLDGIDDKSWKCFSPARAMELK